MNIGEQLAQLAREIWPWQQATFGDGCTVHGAMAKVRVECAEAESAWERCMLTKLNWRANERAIQALLEEMADIYFMLVQLAGAADIALPSPRLTVDGRPLRAAMMRIADCALPLRSAIGAALDWWWAACKWTECTGEIAAAIRAKLAKNKARTWGKPAADGTISHVKPAPKGGEV